MPEQTVDLHLHTRFSDGTETPQRVVELAREAGLSAISITDHDNTEALAVAAPVAAQYGMELIPGIEMSAATDGREVHILGYFIDPSHAEFRRHLAEQQARRVQRVHEMVVQLGRIGVTLTAQEVFALAGEGTVGRPHVARALVNRSYVASTTEAFDRYLGDGKPGFVPGSTMLPSRIIQLIRAAGGVPVLAHPIYLKSDAFIAQFAREGLAGLEVYHSSHTPDVINRYERMADELKLLRTGGSDFHGDAKEGLPVGAVKAPYALVEALKQWKTAQRC